MKYEKVKNLKSEEFKRFTGIHLTTFQTMVTIVKNHFLNKKKKSGRPNNLIIEDQILLTLEYFREYRTYFHLAIDYNLEQSNVYRTIKKIEKILINSQEFKLPGKKILTQKEDESKINQIVIDVTEGDKRNCGLGAVLKSSV